MIEQGEIFMADLDVAGKHWVIVISREQLNRGNYVLAVVCTSRDSPSARRSLIVSLS